MIILDSNIWIALLNEEDSQHQRAANLLNRIEASILIPEYVIIEVCTILLIKAGKKISSLFLDTILDNRDIAIQLSNPVFFTAVISEFKNNQQPNLSFVDISLLYLAQQHEVLTFDTNLQKAIKNLDLLNKS